MRLIRNLKDFTVPCFWIDALLLRKNNDEENEITADTIDSSKKSDMQLNRIKRF